MMVSVRAGSSAIAGHITDVERASLSFSVMDTCDLTEQNHPVSIHRVRARSDATRPPHAKRQVGVLTRLRKLCSDMHHQARMTERATSVHMRHDMDGSRPAGGVPT